MQVDELLARDGLPGNVRLMIVAAVAIWRADWTRLRECSARARARGIARTDLEETLLQAVLFCGFPRVVTAFEHLEAAWPAPSPPAGGGLSPAEQANAGPRLFAGIYGRNRDAVAAMLRGYHQELHDFVLEAAYGRILSRPHLDPLVRELIAIALLAAQDQRRQFAGHARGAMNFGATTAELREALVTTCGDTPEVDDWLQRVP